MRIKELKREREVKFLTFFQKILYKMFDYNLFFISRKYGQGYFVKNQSTKNHVAKSLRRQKHQNQLIKKMHRELFSSLQ